MTVITSIDTIGKFLRTLDRRRHAVPARLEVSQDNNHWTAMIMADPLRRPMCADGHSPMAAIQALADEIIRVYPRVGRAA